MSLIAKLNMKPWLWVILLPILLLGVTLGIQSTAYATNLNSGFAQFIDKASSPGSNDPPTQATDLLSHLVSASSPCSTSGGVYRNGAVLGFDGGEAYDSLLGWSEAMANDIDREGDWMTTSWSLISKLKGELGSGMSMEYSSANSSEGWCSYIVRMAADSGVPISGKPANVNPRDEEKTALIDAVATNCTQAFSTATDGVVGVPAQITAFIGGLSDQDFVSIVESRKDAIMVGGVGSGACDELAKALASQLEVFAGTFCETNPSSSACVEAAEPVSECRISGVGWLVCPVVRFMAQVVDRFYSFIASMLQVSPRFFFTEGGNYGPVHEPWSRMQGIANVLFAVAFIFIIYSQLTSAGISNYGIKRMLPKLIIGAFLINASYLISAVAVDIANLLGESLYNVLVSTSQNLYPATPSETGGGLGESLGGDSPDWDTLALMAMSTAGAVAVGTGLLSISLLLPILVAAFLAIATVAIVLTLRQVLIVGLIIIAPIAFVAYLLPNTEQWFKRWFATFRTMLMLYPVIAVIFGASAIANRVLNAVGDEASGSAGPLEIGPFMWHVMAAGASILPLFITPILMKTTTGVLGQVTGMVNNKERGILDRSKNFARNRQNARNQATLAGEGRFGARGNFNPIGRVGRGINNVRRSRKANLDRLDAMQEADWRGSNSLQVGGKTLFKGGKQANLELNAAQLALQKIKVDAEIEDLEYNETLHVDAAVSNMQLDAAKTGQAAMISGMAASGAGLQGAAAKQALEDKFVSDLADSANKREITSSNADAILERGRDVEAAGVDTRFGPTRAQAYADQTKEKQMNENVAAEKTLLGSVSGDELVKRVENRNGSIESIMAASGEIASRGNMGDKIKLMRTLNSQMIIAAAAKRSGVISANPQVAGESNEDYGKRIEQGIDAAILGDESLKPLVLAQKQAISDMGEMPFGVSDTMRGELGRGVSRQDFDKSFNSRVVTNLKPEMMGKLKSEEIDQMVQFISAGPGTDPIQAKQHADAIASLDTTIAGLNKNANHRGNIKIDLKKRINSLAAGGHLSNQIKLD